MEGTKNSPECRLLATAVQALHVNGQETDDTLAAVYALGRITGIDTTVILRWGELILKMEWGDRLKQVEVFDSVPSGIVMNRVETIMGVVAQASHGKMTADDARIAISAAAQEPPTSTMAFVLASAAAAGSLGIIFGAKDHHEIPLIALSAGLAALIRRGLARLGVGVVAQTFAAALWGGVIGAFAVRWHFSADLRLVAVCQCMILAPGAHIINGALDLVALRIPLGLARLMFAALILLAICVGLIGGLGAAGLSLPLVTPSRHVILPLDTLAAGVSSAAYGLFYSMRMRTIIWPAIAGMVAHTLRWLALSELHLQAPAAAGLACFVVSALLIPVARRLRLPFAAIGFASIGALLPGIYILHMSSGFYALRAYSPEIGLPLVVQTLSYGVTSLLIVLAMIFGLVLPQGLYDALGRLRKHAFPVGGTARGTVPRGKSA